MDKHLLTRSAAAAALLVVMAVGCTDDEPTACDEAENLQASVGDLLAEETLEGGREALDAGLEQVGDDLEALRDAADEEIGSEVSALGDELGGLGETLSEIDTDDLSGSREAVEAQVRDTGDAWSALVDQVQASIDECRVDDTLE